MVSPLRTMLWETSERKVIIISFSCFPGRVVDSIYFCTLCQSSAYSTGIASIDNPPPAEALTSRRIKEEHTDLSLSKKSNHRSCSRIIIFSKMPSNESYLGISQPLLIHASTNNCTNNGRKRKVSNFLQYCCFSLLSLRLSLGRLCEVHTSPINSTTAISSKSPNIIKSACCADLKNSLSIFPK